MPCLNEARSIETCIRNASSALEVLRSRHGLVGEIIVADNGSTDGSDQIATNAGARVVPVPAKGYGAALIGGFTAAGGRYLVMGDADGSYDFMDSVPMIEGLMGGADICMGSRFKGTIKRGAMPWKNRYIGNPVLTTILNVLFRTKVSDAHCGIRALTKPAFDSLRLEGRGMEFASEMLIKAALLRLRISEVPASLSPDLRGGPPHLRPWRDGWRHLRYLLMLSPYWVFAIPALLGASFAIAVLLIAIAVAFLGQESAVGNYWVILAGALLCLSHEALIMGIAGQIYGIRDGYRRPDGRIGLLRPALSLERMLVSGALSVVAGGAILAAVLFYWSTIEFQRIANVLPAVVGTTLVVLGMQNILGGFLLAIVAGNDADFFAGMARRTQAGDRNTPLPRNASDGARSNV
jgi:glycosyltransferase involved in cell wall biosynthesis